MAAWRPLRETDRVVPRWLIAALPKHSGKRGHMRLVGTSSLAITSLLAVLACSASPRSPDDNGIDFVLIHPPFSDSYSCSEHWDGQLPYLGDSLGADCTIGKLVENNGRIWMHEYQHSGLENEDWYGYGSSVLAPCDCTVTTIRVNPDENLPGQLGKPPASSITFERPDGTLILFAHVKNIQVSEGDQVGAGEVVASVGNNGYSRQPHVHIGAWRGKEAIQIRFDQKRMKSDKEE